MLGVFSPLASRIDRLAGWLPLGRKMRTDSSTIKVDDNAADDGELKILGRDPSPCSYRQETSLFIALPKTKALLSLHKGFQP